MAVLDETKRLKNSLRYRMSVTEAGHGPVLPDVRPLVLRFLKPGCSGLVKTWWFSRSRLRGLGRL